MDLISVPRRARRLTFLLPFVLTALLPALTGYGQSVATFNQRAQVVLNSIPDTASSIESYSIQFQLWASESLYLKGLDAQAKTLLINALPQMHEPATPDDDAFNLIAAVDVMERWPGHFSPNPDPNPSVNLTNDFQSTLTGFQYWNSASTSNQLVMAAVARYLSYEAYPNATFASGFASNDPNGRTFLLCYMTQVVTHNLQEYDSDVYTGAYLTSFRLLADYAQDPTIKQDAELTYDWLLVNAASTWMNSTWAATSYRRYFDILPQDQMETGSWTLWPLFGGPAPGSGFNLALMQGAIQTIATCQCATGYAVESGTAYTPRQEIMDLLAWSTAPNAPSSYPFEARTYTPSSPYNQYMQYSYITKNYALFGEADFNTSNGAKLALQPPAQVLSGVVWNPSTANAAYPSLFYAGAPRWQVDTTPTTPTGCPNGSADCSVSNHTFGFGQYGQYFQNQNAQVAVYDYNITTTYPEPTQFYIYAPLCTANAYPYTFPSGTTIPNFPCTTATVPLAMITSETATLGHLYLYYDNVLISLWLSTPFTWDGLHEITAYNASSLSSNSILASAIEVASPASYAGSTPAATLANFAQYMDAHASLNSAGLTGTNPSATYTASNGSVMQNVFNGQNYLNGTAVAYANWPLMQTPWVQQSWLSSVACVSCYAGSSNTYTGIGGGGNLTVTSPVTGNQLLYNFSSETVTEMLAQTVSFAALASPVTVGGTATLSATASSGLAVTYAVTGPATISGTTISYTGAGTVQVTATQAGNTTYLPASVTQTITVVNSTTTAVSFLPASPTYGTQVTLTATVTHTAGSVAPTGSVSFYDGGSLLGSGTLSGNAGSYALSTLAVGTHSITAVYSGDGNYAGSSSTAMQLIVAAASSGLSITASPTSAVFETPILFTATLTPASSVYVGESIKFYQGTTQIGTGTLNAAGTATFSTPALNVGTDSITAQYAGDTDYSGSVTPTAAQVVISAMPTTVSLTASPATVVAGTAVQLSVVVHPQSGAVIPGGTISYSDSGTSIGQSTLNASGTTTFSISSLAVGAHSITASYAATGNFGGSTSTAASVTVTAAPTYSLAVSPTSITVNPGASATAAVTLTPTTGYAQTVALSCGSGLPAYAVCAVAPAAVSFLPSSQTPQSATLTVTVAAAQASLRRDGRGPMLALVFWIPAAALAFGVQRRRSSLLAVLLVFGLLTSLSGCSSPATTTSIPAGTYTVPLTATDGTTTHSVSISVTIQ